MLRLALIATSLLCASALRKDARGVLETQEAEKVSAPPPLCDEVVVQETCKTFNEGEDSTEVTLEALKAMLAATTASAQSLWKELHLDGSQSASCMDLCMSTLTTLKGFDATVPPSSDVGCKMDASGPVCNVALDIATIKAVTSFTGDLPNFPEVEVSHEDLVKEKPSFKRKPGDAVPEEDDLIEYHAWDGVLRVANLFRIYPMDVPIMIDGPSGFSALEEESAGVHRIEVTLTKGAESSWGLKLYGGSTEVMSVTRGGVADRAGVKENDVIIADPYNLRADLKQLRRLRLKLERKSSAPAYTDHNDHYDDYGHHGTGGGNFDAPPPSNNDVGNFLNWVDQNQDSHAQPLSPDDGGYHGGGNYGGDNYGGDNYGAPPPLSPDDGGYHGGGNYGGGSGNHGGGSYGGGNYGGGNDGGGNYGESYAPAPSPDYRPKWRRDLEERNLQAQAYVSHALKQLRARRTGRNIDKWFGSGTFNDDERRRELTRLLNSVDEMLDNVEYEFPGPECKPNVYAYVYPRHPDSSKVKDHNGKLIFYLCQLYVDSPVSVQIETLTHEGSHHATAFTTDVCADELTNPSLRPVLHEEGRGSWPNRLEVGEYYNQRVRGITREVQIVRITPHTVTTQEADFDRECETVAYGRDTCEGLARVNPFQAMRNADNLCYYIQDVTDDS